LQENVVISTVAGGGNSVSSVGLSTDLYEIVSVLLGVGLGETGSNYEE
jgi:hypothetical protein